MSDESGNNFGIAIIGAVANIFLGVSVEMSLALQNQWIIKVVVVLCAGISCFLILYSARKEKVISQKKKKLLGLLAAFLFGCALATYIVGLFLGNNGDRVTGGNQTASIAPTSADTPSPIRVCEEKSVNSDLL